MFRRDRTKREQDDDACGVSEQRCGQPTATASDATRTGQTAFRDWAGLDVGGEGRELHAREVRCSSVWC